MGPDERRRVSVGLTQLVIVGVFVLAMAGSALAAGHYLITSVKQISPSVRASLRGTRGPSGLMGATGTSGTNGTNGTNGTSGTNGANGTNGTNGTNGINGQGPALAVTDAGGVVTSSDSDVDTHSIATLAIPSAGLYTVTAKLNVFVHGGSGTGTSNCTLTALTTGGAADTDMSTTSLENTGSVSVEEATVPLELTHQFTGPGSINLSCAQNGLVSGGALFTWNYASIIATQMSSLTSTAVTS